MKYYETKYEEYLRSVQHYNIHPNLSIGLPDSINQLTNLIFYGPPGSGKYSQMLSAIQRYSPSALEYDKKMYVQTEKYAYQFRISDIHYEIDMALLGCNSKLLRRDIYSQIVDIISVKTDKCGIIVCKNFHPCGPQALTCISLLI
jgi:Cdc6-like AAA superfamily ATPase